MRRTIKRLICGALAVMVSASTMAMNDINTYATEANKEYVCEGKLGDNVEYTYNSDTSTLVVSGTGEMWDGMSLPIDVLKATSLVIDKGVTTIGAYAFDDIKELKNIQIANTVTTIKERAFGYIYGDVEIPASVSKVEKAAFAGATKYIIKGNVKGYDFGALGYMNDGEVVVCGSAEELGKAVIDSYKEYLIVTLAEDNKQCTIKNGCLLSNDGKKLYYYVGTSKKVTIPDTVEVICDGAFAIKDEDDRRHARNVVKEVTFGKNVKEIGESAFEYSYIKKVRLPKSLKKIGKKAFNGTLIENVELNSKVSIGEYAFGNYESENKTVIKNRAGIRKASTVITKATIGAKKADIRFLKVYEASGYEIKIKAGKKSYKYYTTKTEFKGKINKKITDYNKEYKGTFDGEGMNPIAVTVRPYKLVKGKKIYGKSSVKFEL